MPKILTFLRVLSLPSCFHLVFNVAHFAVAPVERHDAAVEVFHVEAGGGTREERLEIRRRQMDLGFLSSRRRRGQRNRSRRDGGKDIRPRNLPDRAPPASLKFRKFRGRWRFGFTKVDAGEIAGIRARVLQS